MSTAVSSQPVSAVSPATAIGEVRVYSNSPIFYWWPVWAVGYLLAVLTLMYGDRVRFVQPDKEAVVQADNQEVVVNKVTEVKIHPARSLGVIFTFTFLLVILITHFAVRGIASLAVILAGIALVLFFAYMGWWEDIFRALGNLAIFMNLGFYVFFSTSLFIVWALAVFVYVRLNYYVFRPGQLVHVTLWGGGERTYDTRGMSVVKERSDLFRHWILGLGSGDLHVATTGARSEEFVIPNVLFVGWKLQKIQRLVALAPDDVTGNTFTAGQPE